jgi:hypothetical protein
VLEGREGDDVLIGSDGNDAADGGTGADACDAETETGCETDPQAADGIASLGWLARPSR